MKNGELKNHGKSLLAMINDLPADILTQISAKGFEVVSHRLRPEEMERLMAALPAEKAELGKMEIPDLREKGLTDNAFISQQIEWAALYSGLSSIKGAETADAILKASAETAYPELFALIFPEPDELKQRDDPFNAFCSWFSAMMVASRHAGLFAYEIVEDTDDALQVNIRWCAWAHIIKFVGIAQACRALCHVDDVFYPDYLKELPISFKRTQTIGWGGQCCDFRFERK